MKRKYIHIRLYVAIAVGMLSCNKLDTRIDTLATEETIRSGYTSLRNFGYAPYGYLRTGFATMGGNLFATVTDEAEHTDPGSASQLFNQGSITPFSNPDNVYARNYEGIRAANYFLENSVNYREILALNRDTISDGGYQYGVDVGDIAWLRHESRVLRAYYYFDLIKRYGGVPLVTRVLQLADNTDLPKERYETLVEYIVSEIDDVKDNLQVNWRSFDEGRDGRFTKGAALALKSRVLLYAASPLHNATNDLAKWQRAAAAAREVIQLNQYGFHAGYAQLFVDVNTVLSTETIMAIRSGSTSQMEQLNYPVGTPGGASGIAPSQNLVEAYEYTGAPDPNNPFANRDPRLAATVAYNNSQWNGRTLQIWSGGQDDPANNNASPTGYYLKKFLNDNLNLVQGEARLRSWPLFRYPEILLNYAEAMNEAYGPDNDNGYGLSARQALNMVRNRPAVQLPDVVATTQAEMRNRIKHERRIELAFEDHRYWDLVRWKEAEVVLNQPLRGIRATNNGDNAFEYTVFEVEQRVFPAPRMYYYPIPQTELNKSDGILTQNEGW